MRPAESLRRTRVIGLLVLGILVGLSGCGNEARRSAPAGAGLQVQLIFPDKDLASARTVAAVQTVRLSAWELPGNGAPRILRGRATATIPPGTTRFHLEIQVPPANRYQVQVEAAGTWGPLTNPTGSGLLFLGGTEITDLLNHETRPVVIQMLLVVPSLNGGVDATGVRLSWNAISTALGYRLLETFAPPTPSRETFTQRTDTTIVFPPTLRPQAPQLRGYRVSAVLSDSLVSAYSDSVLAAFPEPVPPARIIDLRVTQARDTELRLEWTATGDNQESGTASQYDLRRAAAPITTEADFTAATPIPGLPAPLPSGRSESFTVTGLNPATTYFFSIKAADRVPLWSPLSNTAEGTTLPTPPAAPVNLVATAVSDVAIRLQWIDQATNESLYRIERRAPSDPDFVLADTLPGSFSGPVSYLDGNLTERTIYHYRVRAENAGGSSPWSNEVTQRTGVAAPAGLTATATAPDSVTLSWRFGPPDPLGGFLLERRDPGQGFTQVLRPAASARAQVDATVRPFTTYAYRMRAVDADTSGYSDSAVVTTPDIRPSCLVSADTLRFGTVPTGSTADLSFTISNTGGSVLTGDVSLRGTGFTIIAGGGPFSLHAGEEHPVTVRFAPTGAGAASCQIDTGTRLCGLVYGVGTGEAPPRCVIIPATLDFGSPPVGTAVQDSVVVRNDGGGTLLGNVSALPCPGNDFLVYSGVGAISLRSGETRTLRIRFSPTRTGVQNCVLDVAGQGCSVSLTGSGASLPTCTVRPDRLDFGHVVLGDSLRLGFTIKNNGGGTLSGDVSSTCPSFTVVKGTSSYSLAAGESLSVTVEFRPASLGPAACDLNLGNIDCPTVSCTGTGDPVPLPPVCHVSAGQLAFGTVTVGTTKQLAFTIKNIGGGTLNGTVLEICPAYSIVAGGGSFSLAAGDSVRVTVEFAPAQPGIATCNVGLGTDACPGVACTGTGEAAPACLVDPLQLDFGQVQQGSSSRRTFTITNTGGGTLFGTITPSCPQFVVLDTNTYQLTAGQIHTVTVAFVPDAVTTFQCTVDAGASCPQAVSCTGVGLPPPTPNDHWSPEFGPQGLDGSVSDMVALPGVAGQPAALAVCGYFTLAGTTPVSNLALWDGSAWIAPATPPTTNVRVVGQAAGLLYAAGGDPADPGLYRVARLSNGVWSFVGGSFDAPISTMVSLNGSIYAGGSFFNVDGSPNPFVVQWTGSIWQSVAGGLTGAPSKMRVINGVLYAAVPNGDPSGLYRLQGSQWVLVVAENGIQALAFYGGNLYVGGFFTSVAQVPANYIARFDGVSWFPVGTGGTDGTDGEVADLAVYNNTLIVAGGFANAGGIPASLVARWNGSVWSALGSGITGGEPYVTTVTAFGPSVYVGGGFSTAGEKSSRNIARWTD